MRRIKNRKNLPGLNKQGNQYRYRITVPRGLEEGFGGKPGKPRCIIEMLPTADEEAAYQMKLDRDDHYRREFAEMRAAQLDADRLEILTLTRTYHRCVTHNDYAGIHAIIMQLAAKHGITPEDIVLHDGDVEQAFAAPSTNAQPTQIATNVVSLPVPHTKPTKAVIDLRQVVGVVPPQTTKTPFDYHLKEYCEAAAKTGEPPASTMPSIISQVTQFSRFLTEKGLGLEDMADRRESRALALAWGQMKAESVGHGTVETMLNNVARYWKWMVKRPKEKRKVDLWLPERRGDHPFSGHLDQIGGRKARKVRAYDENDVIRIFDEAMRRYHLHLAENSKGKERIAPRYLEIAQSVLIAAMMGPRIESIVEMNTKYFSEEEGRRVYNFCDKTEAGDRYYPIPPVLAPLFDYLIAHAEPNGNLFRHAGNHNGEQWHRYLKIILDHLKIDRTVTDKSRLNPYHSFRHRFNLKMLATATQGTTRWARKYLMGHHNDDIDEGDRPGQYGEPPPMAMRWHAVTLIQYPGVGVYQPPQSRKTD